MNNPFELIDARLSNIENLLISIKYAPKEKNKHPESDELLTIDEVAELLHLSKTTVYSKHSKGEIPGVCKKGKRLYFQRQVIIDWIKSGRRKTNAEIQAEAQTYFPKRVVKRPVYV